VVIALRGLSQYQPRPHQINLLWLISHPDRVSDEELEAYDHVFVASRPHAERLAARLATPTSALLQCTDAERFAPPEAAAARVSRGVVLVGNSRNHFRQIVRDCLEADIDFKVVGTRWEKILDADRILAQHVPNRELPAFYASCELVLNDHWETMREHGFISNRLFDAAACGAQIVSDRVEGIEEIFGDALATYDSPQELALIAKSAPERLRSGREARTALAERIRREHSFEVRVAEILSVTRELDARKLRGPSAAARLGSGNATID
jgi:glycosyltransferase involved in cell wall biosynthesis